MPKSRTSLWTLAVATALAAGCASPTAPPTTAELAAPASALPDEPAPGAPVAAAPSLQTFAGQASFGNEHLADFALTVLDARTQRPLPVVASAAGVAAGQPAVVAGAMRTDAEGRFELQVAGLRPGQVLRIVAAKGSATLELLVAADASDRKTLQGPNQLQIDALSTALAKLGRGMAQSSLVLPPEKAAPVIAKLMAELDVLRAHLAPALQNSPSMAHNLLECRSLSAATQQEASNVQVLLSPEAMRELCACIAALLRELAEQAKAAYRPSPAVLEALSDIDFIGTGLKAKLGPDGTFWLINTLRGTRVDVCTGNIEAIWGPTSGGGGGGGGGRSGSTSATPTPHPTPTPSSSPSDESSASPSTSPTPSSAPSGDPPGEPSATPTPSSSPSGEPSATPTPSNAPSGEPSASPSASPTPVVRSTYELIAPETISAVGRNKASEAFVLTLRPRTVGQAGYEHMRVIFTLLEKPAKNAKATLLGPAAGRGVNLLTEGIGPKEGMAFGPEATLDTSVRFLGSSLGRYAIRADVVDLAPGGGFTVLSSTTFRAEITAAHGR